MEARIVRLSSPHFQVLPPQRFHKCARVESLILPPNGELLAPFVPVATDCSTQGDACCRVDGKQPTEQQVRQRRWCRPPSISGICVSKSFSFYATAPDAMFNLDRVFLTTLSDSTGISRQPIPACWLPTSAQATPLAQISVRMTTRETGVRHDSSDRTSRLHSELQMLLLAPEA